VSQLFHILKDKKYIKLKVAISPASKRPFSLVKCITDEKNTRSEMPYRTEMINENIKRCLTLCR